MKVWQVLALVAVGVLAGLIAPGKFEYAFGHATLYVFLPALLFEASWNLDFEALRRQWRAVAVLAGPGVLLTSGIIAAAMIAAGAPFSAAVLTGAILSATDPIAVVAIFRRLNVAPALAAIVEGEALFNDAVAVALYRGALLALATAATTAGSIALVVLGTGVGAGGGVAFGVLLAYAVTRLLRRMPSVPLQIAATIFCAYGAYFAAERLQLSGIFATIACGIALRYFERSWISRYVHEEVDRFWSAGALLANALVFFLVGAALDIHRVAEAPLFAAAALAGVAAARFGVAALLAPMRSPRAWLSVLRVAGMRGALCLALALALPASYPYRETIVDVTFAVTLATLIVSGVSLERVVRRAATRQTPSG